MSLRTEKVESTILAQAAEYFARQPSRDFLLTVTGVDVSPDLKHATIWVSLIPVPEEIDKLLESHAKPLARHIAARSTTKFSPKVRLALDTGAEHTARIHSLIH